MTIVHLTGSPFFGGPERQMLGLALALPPSCRSAFLLFRDHGKSQAFRRRLLDHALEAVTLPSDTPHLPAMVREVSGWLEESGADVLCCHGYKADIVGLMAARRVGVPAVAVSRGWTGATWAVRCYEALDRAALRRMDRVVCVSEGQARKVRRAGVRADRVVVIRNAIRAERFGRVDPAGRGALEGLFPRPPSRVVGSAGRLSPEKGIGVLVEAAAIVARSDAGAGFVHFGDGPLRGALERRVVELGLVGRFVLAGFRDDLDRFVPHWDLCVLPSYTEGLPNVVLESYAAGVPVVATAVGGTPEAVDDGVDGHLVPAGDATALARRILELLADDDRRRAMGRLGRDRVLAEFTFDVQARRYLELCADLGRSAARAATAGQCH